MVISETENGTMFLESPAYSARSLMLCMALGLILAVLPKGLSLQARTVVKTALLPGQIAVRSGYDRLHAALASTVHEELQSQAREIEVLKQRLRQAEARQTQSMLVATDAQRRLAEIKQRPSDLEVADGTPLFAWHSLEAHVVGRELATLWKSKRLIRNGSRDGIQDDQWVLDGRELVVDQGESQNVMPGMMAFAGRSIVGRVHQAGSQISSIELITDRTFRAQAAIGRQSENRIEFSSVGLLEGDGNGLCRMTLPDSSEPVAVGDAVYSVPKEPSYETRLLFGRVVSITRSALQSEMIVQPATDLAGLRTVQILAPALNAHRLAGNQ